ncbi:MAG: aspartate aminotransferase family protein [Thermoplasmata archaeon]|nr:aspartate aminotransferase family protein [Thermoplasmata archaeon]TFG68100.1 MAG: aspartate aminotransferase family protein [Methanomassiliicoccus sp.]
MSPYDAVAEYKTKTQKSAKWFEFAKEYLPGGVTGNVKFYPPYPIYANKAKGSHIWDLDGNEYIDYMLCFGPMILGHGHPKVHEAIIKQLETDGTTIFGAPHEMEAKMAQRLEKIFPCAEYVRFTNSGLEATLHSLRIARGYKKKNRIAKFEGHYHGCYDEALVSLTPSEEVAGPEAAPQAVACSMGTSEYTLQSTQVLPFNDIHDTIRLLKAHKNDLAAVIMEPVQRGFIEGEPEFLKAVRETTAELDIVLIFDEVMSGFRMDKLGGAQTMVGITPDLMCLGKIMGGGFPCGAFLGREDIMDVVNPVTRGKENRVFHGGTFNGHPTVLAAGMATIDILEQPETYPYLMRITDKFQDGLNDLFQRLGFNAKAMGPGSTFNVLFGKDGQKLDDIRDYRHTLKADETARKKFDYGLLARGLHFHPDKPFYTCTEHTDEDIDNTLEVAEEVLKKMKSAM